MKNNIQYSFLNNKATLVETATIGNPHFFATYRLSDGTITNVKMVDTAGQEKYKALTSNYYKDADCCLLVYDIANKKSFLEIKNYYCSKIEENCKKNIKVVLLGNKNDLDQNREVTSQEGADLSAEKGYTFMETSCLNNENVADAFETLIEDTSRVYINNNRGQQLDSKKEKKKEGCC